MKKIFFVSISMLPVDKLKPLYYSIEGSNRTTDYKTCYPSIPMIENNVSAEDEVKIVAIMTDDDNDNTKGNFNVFLRELEALSNRIGIKLTVSETVSVPHNETREKLVALLKALSDTYEKGADVYMDVTYGSKVTSIELFSSLVYGVKVKKCNLRSIVYGKYNHNEKEDHGVYFDIRYLYDLSNLIYAADYLPEDKVDSLLDQFWG